MSIKVETITYVTIKDEDIVRDNSPLNEAQVNKLLCVANHPNPITGKLIITVGNDRLEI